MVNMPPPTLLVDVHVPLTVKPKEHNLFVAELLCAYKGHGKKKNEVLKNSSSLKLSMLPQTLPSTRKHK